MLHYKDQSHRSRGVPCRLKALNEVESKAVRREEKRIRGRRDLDLPYHYRLGCIYCKHETMRDEWMLSHLKYQYAAAVLPAKIWLVLTRLCSNHV